MKRFIKFTAIFLFPILIFGIIAEFLLRHIPNDYKLKNDYLEKHSNQLKIIFLGSSHAYYGINPIYIKESSFNAAYVAQMLNLDYEILNKYDGKWKSLKFIALPISYFSLNSSLGNGVENWRVKNYRIYYHMDVTNNISECFEILGKFKLNFKKLNEYYFNKKNSLSSSNLGWGLRKGARRDLAISGKERANRHTYFNDVLFKENKVILEKIIYFSEQRNIQVLFYTPPAYKTYVQHLNKTQLNQMIRLMNELAARYRNVIYKNMLEDHSFKDTDFNDADHLNEIGAKKFSLKMDSIINLNWN